jgi:tight adherence protein B
MTGPIVRARVRRRVRRLAPSAGWLERLAERRGLPRRLREAGVEERSGSWLRRAVAYPIGAAAAGTLAVGLVGAVLGAAAGAVVPFVLLRRRAAARSLIVESQLPDSLRCIAAALRAGQSLVQALATAADDAPVPLQDSLRSCVARIAAGASVDEALSGLEHDCTAPSISAAVAAMRVGRASGGNLPLILDTAVESMLDRQRLADERRSATAQARLSATVVASMPLVFLLMLGATARRQLRDALSQPAGLALFGAGFVLEAAGVLWLRKVLEPPS